LMAEKPERINRRDDRAKFAAPRRRYGVKTESNAQDGPSTSAGHGSEAGMTKNARKT
jgi:hypothetical protein